MKIHKQNAFTMLELIMVIVVLGILASLAMPRLDRDLGQEAGDSILSAIRHAQHMALVDDVTNPSVADWQKSFWSFGVESCNDNGIFYYVGADKDRGGDIDSIESAIDPKNGLRVMGINGQPCESESDVKDQITASPDIFITKRFGIENGDITFTNCGSGGRYIGFDHMGRPHNDFKSSTKADYSSVITTDCTITLRFDDTSINEVEIKILKETGYAFIVGQDAIPL